MCLAYLLDWQPIKMLKNHYLLKKLLETKHDIVPRAIKLISPHPHMIPIHMGIRNILICWRQVCTLANRRDICEEVPTRVSFALQIPFILSLYCSGLWRYSAAASPFNGSTGLGYASNWGRNDSKIFDKSKIRFQHLKIKILYDSSKIAKLVQDITRSE